MSGRSSKTKRREADLTLSQARDISSSRQRTTSLHIGPLPSPEILAGYKEFVPDAPERILAMAEKEQAARIEREREMAAAIERDAVSARESQKRADRNSVLFFLSCLTAGCGVLYFGFSEWLAGALMGAPVLSAIAAILRARFR